MAKKSTPKDLSCIGVNSLGAALLVMPTGYIDKTQALTCPASSPQDTLCLWKAKVTWSQGKDRNGNDTKSPCPAQVWIKVIFEDGTPMEIRSFGAGSLWAYLEKGETIVFRGTLLDKPWGLSIYGAVPDLVTGRVQPIYAGVPGQVAGALIEQKIDEAIDQIDDALPTALKLIEGSGVVATHVLKQFKSIKSLLRCMHRPRTVEEGEFALAVAKSATIAQIRSYGMAAACTLGPQYDIDKELIAAVGQQPEILSPGQRKALNKIRVAINNSSSAKVLLNGDVGSGKTLVFLLAAVAVARETGGVACVMVPSELVAMQMHANAVKRFPDLAPALITGSKQSFAANTRLFIGTQALLSLKTDAPAEILVVDEQHKLSVEQRGALVGPSTHVIEASATPIPRSLALALFDGWIEARIEGCPVEKHIDCHLVEPDDQGFASRVAHSHIVAGKKVIFVYPRLNSDKEDTKSVLQACEALNGRFPDKVVALHGKLKPEQKSAALARFASGEQPIAVATTVIEVGVDVPDVGCMIVTSADRFGAAQLHQLRGRLVRNGGRGDFVMIPSGKTTKATRSRLEAVQQNQNGFDLAEADMMLRGFGNLLGEMQSGATETLFKLARIDAHDFIKA